MLNGPVLLQTLCTVYGSHWNNAPGYCNRDFIYIFIFPIANRANWPNKDHNQYNVVLCGSATQRYHILCINAKPWFGFFFCFSLVFVFLLFLLLFRIDRLPQSAFRNWNREYSICDSNKDGEKKEWVNKQTNLRGNSPMRWTVSIYKYNVL